MAVVAAVCLLAAPARADERLVEVGLRERVVQLVADGDSTCALTESGDVFCWGASHPEPYRPGADPLLLVATGAFLITAGLTLLMVSRSRPRAPRPEAPTPPA